MKIDASNKSNLKTKINIKSINVAGNEFGSARFINYRENMDFTGATYPVRMLTLSLDAKDISLIGEKSYTDGDMKRVFKVKIILEQVGALNDNPVGDPIEIDGEYLGYFRDTRMHSNITSALTTEDKSKDSNSAWTPSRMNYEIMLMRANETAIGNKSLVNFNLKQGKVFDAFLAGFCQSCSGMKIISSKPRVNTTVTNFLVPPIGFVEYMDLLENEFGFYDTPYMTWMENGLFYLLNTNNEHDVAMKSNTTYRIHVAEPRAIQSVFNFSPLLVEVTVNSSSIKKRTSISGNEPNSYYYKQEDGSIVSKPGNSRQYQILEKTNSAPKIQPINPLQREVCEVLFPDFAFSNITPLTYFYVHDLDGDIKKYRVSAVERSISGVDSVTMVVKLFRNLNEK
ncbi:MAG: hypothetical protein ACRCX2_28510 [Paraclostridium sp.]